MRPIMLIGTGKVLIYRQFAPLCDFRHEGLNFFEINPLR